MRVFFAVGVGFASHNVIYFWRNCGEGKEREGGREGEASQTGVVSHAGLVLNPSGHREGHTHFASAQSLPLPRESERALYLTLSLSLCQSVSLPPWLAACAGIKCIPHEWIPEIRDGSQRVRCLTWIKAKSLAAAEAGGALCPLFPLPRGREVGEVPLLAHINPSIQPSMLQALVMSMSPHRCHYQFTSHFNYLIFLYTNCLTEFTQCVSLPSTMECDTMLLMSLTNYVNIMKNCIIINSRKIIQYFQKLLH